VTTKASLQWLVSYLDDLVGCLDLLKQNTLLIPTRTQAAGADSLNVGRCVADQHVNQAGTVVAIAAVHLHGQTQSRKQTWRMKALDTGAATAMTLAHGALHFETTSVGPGTVH